MKMATDFRISRTLQMGILHPKQIVAVFQVILIINQTFASSVWMPQFLSGGHGRNIRHLPCVSRKTGEQGTCMFAYTCMKSNGTHLGTCIDRFYFGSCCKLEGGNNELLEENAINFQLINNNQVSSPNVPDKFNNFQSVPTTSLPNLLVNKYTVSNAENNFYNISTLPKTEPPLPVSGSYGGLSSDKTEVSSAQNLASETNFLTSSTEKIYVPILTSQKPNRTENLSSSSGFFTTHGSSSSVFSESKKPTMPSQSYFSTTPLPSVTTQSYFLTTFQVVHENDDSFNKSVTPVPPKVTLTNSNKPETATAWTPIKPVTTSNTNVKKNTTVTFVTKPTATATTARPPTTTTKKPHKPVKPATTTRKPPPKKPTPKPTSKPSAVSGQSTKPTPVKKPVQSTFTNKVTPSKPTAPVKKPTPPTKKPIFSSPKPSTFKPVATIKPPSTIKPGNVKPGTKPGVFKPIPTKPNNTTLRPGNRPPFTTTKPVTTSKATYATKTSTTQKPSSILITKPTSSFGITTFRPDLSPTTKRPTLVTRPSLTTFNYTSERVETTTMLPVTDSSQSTISNEIPSSETILENIPEAQEENTNMISQQGVSTMFPGSITQPSLMKPNDTTIPFFPEATKPPWIEIVQSTVSHSTSSTTSKTTTTTTSFHPTNTVLSQLSGVNVSDYTQVCGRRLFPQSRVVGGEKSTFGKWPWQISLRQWRTSTYLHKCGAALLNENWAITAAHCVENVPPSDLLLRLGEHDLSTEDEPYGFQERRVQIVASHPQFDPRTFEYDLALLRFYEPVKFQPNIIPVCVPEDNTNFVGQTAYVTGWGRLYEDGPLPSVLQEVSVPVINNTLCENMYRSAGYIEHIPEIFICAGWKKGGFDSCEGDSGGPMVIQRPDKRWLLAGIISWGIGCAEPNQPGVYTRISEFREWIHQILQF